MSLPSVLLRLSTGEIIKHALYPRADMQLVEGLDPDLEWIVKNTPFDQPDYDSRIFELVTTESVKPVDEADVPIPHPDYPHLNQYLIEYDTNRRSDEEIIQSIENAETQANEERVGYNTRTKLFALALGVLIRRIENLQTNEKEQAILDSMLAIAVDLWKNDAEVQAKKAQLANGEEPDIDALWEKGQ